MDSRERRIYVSDKLLICERSLKKHLKQYYKMNAMKDIGIKTITTLLGKELEPNSEGIKIYDDLFDHKKYKILFSDLRKIYEQNWQSVGKAFHEYIEKKDFHQNMIYLNQGRIDGVHFDPTVEPEYDPEEKTIIEDEELVIDDQTMRNFVQAFEEFEKIFIELDLYRPRKQSH